MDEQASLAAWVERVVGGRVARVDRLARWRPAWDVDVEIDGRVLPLHARGEREPQIVMPYRIADEVATHDLLEAHGVPVPHAYGICDDPYALVMDRLPGQVDLSAVDDAERGPLLDRYLEILARVYDVPITAAAEAGFAVPVDSAATGLGGYWRPMEAIYDPLMEHLPADPMAVFLRRWLRDNVPPDRLVAARFITYDSFQFMFEGSRITGLLDFEHAHVGDPMMDLAALRIRDTIKNIGELSETAARYEAITGITIDHDVVEYHTVLYNAISVLSTGPPLADPVRGTDWLSYLAWYVNGARWAFEAIAEIRGYRLDRGGDPRGAAGSPRPGVPAPRRRPARRSRLRSTATTSWGASGGSPTTSSVSTRSAPRSMLPTSTTSAACSAPDPTRRPPTPSCSTSSSAPASSAKRRSSVCSTRGRNACTSRWRLRDR